MQQESVKEKFITFLHSIGINVTGNEELDLNFDFELEYDITSFTEPQHGSYEFKQTYNFVLTKEKVSNKVIEDLPEPPRDMPEDSKRHKASDLS